MPVLKSTTSLVSLAAMTLLNAMAYASDERAELDLVIQQLHAINQIAARAEQSTSSAARYRFDYPRFHADLLRVETGIKAYLVPSRAQPADPADLVGDYTTEPAHESSP